MKQKILGYILLLCLGILASCSNTLKPKEYVSYVQNPENGLLTKATVNGVKYSLQYEPVDYVVMLELRSFSIPPVQFKEEYNRFKDLEHYVFHIDVKDMQALLSKASDTSKLQKDLMDYFNFSIGKNIKLIENGDTIPCGIAELESGMNMFPYYSFVIGFPTRNYEGDREFLFTNKNLGTGDVKLLIKGSDVKKTPKLKMNG